MKTHVLDVKLMMLKKYDSILSENKKNEYFILIFSTKKWIAPLLSFHYPEGLGNSLVFFYSRRSWHSSNSIKDIQKAPALCWEHLLDGSSSM